MKLIEGNKIAAQIYEQLKAVLTKTNRSPTLVIILANNEEASKTYVKLKQKRAEELGIDVKLINLNATTSKEKLTDQIKELNMDSSVDGILLQLPLYEHLEKCRTEIVNLVDPEKDVDGLTVISQGKLSQGLRTNIPATVSAIMECLNYTKVDITGKHVLIVNHSDLIGKPLTSVLLNKNATVTTTNEHNKNLGNITKQADILITATGQVGLITADMVKENAVVIDVTSLKTRDGVKGDVARTAELDSKVSWLTPVPGGVGPVTIACLLRNLVLRDLSVTPDLIWSLDS